MAIVVGAAGIAPEGLRLLNAAAVGALSDAMPAGRVHRPNEVPDAPVTGYAVVSVDSGATTTYRAGSHSGGSRSHRIVVQAVGRNVDEVTWVVDRAHAVFIDRALSVPELRCTPCRAEVSSPIIRDPDAGAYLSCTLTYTFTSTPA